MIFSFSSFQLRVISSFFVNLAAGWFIALFITRDFLVLTTDFALSIISLQLSFNIEEELEND